MNFTGSPESINDVYEANPEAMNVQEIELKGWPYKTFVAELPYEKLEPNFGYAGNNIAFIRSDLSPRVKGFVIEHELHHLKERYFEWIEVDNSFQSLQKTGVYNPPITFSWGRLGQTLASEFRANIVPGIKDPLGLAATIWASITSRDRILLYIDRLVNND